MRPGWMACLQEEGSQPGLRLLQEAPESSVESAEKRDSPVHHVEDDLSVLQHSARGLSHPRRLHT